MIDHPLLQVLPLEQTGLGQGNTPGRDSCSAVDAEQQFLSHAATSATTIPWA
jgi:hypothetical protein